MHQYQPSHREYNKDITPRRYIISHSYRILGIYSVYRSGLLDRKKTGKDRTAVKIFPFENEKPKKDQLNKTG
jgi:hypothetical protein